VIKYFKKNLESLGMSAPKRGCLEKLGLVAYVIGRLPGTNPPNFIHLRLTLCYAVKGIIGSDRY
jgi:hypothetical protein